MPQVSTIRTVTARVFILIQSLGRQTVFGQLGSNPRHKAAALATHLAVAAGLPATTEAVDVEVDREVFHFTWNIVRCLAAVVAGVVPRPLLTCKSRMSPLSTVSCFV